MTIGEARDGEVVRVDPQQGVYVRVLPDVITGLLPFDQISQESVEPEQLISLFTPGEKMKVGSGYFSFGCQQATCGGPMSMLHSFQHHLVHHVSCL